MRLTSICLACAALSAATPVPAATLYSIDVNSDIVATIDTGTGTVGSIDPTPFWPFGNAVLAHHGSLLYEINTPPSCDDESFARLTVIDPSGPSVVSGFTLVRLGGVAINDTRIGDITSNGTDVFVTYRPLGCGPTLSQLATLSASGDLTLVADFSGISADMDEIAASGTGQLYALDERSAAGQADLYLVTPPSTYELVGTHPMTPGAGLLGMTFDATGGLWVLERTFAGTGLIRRIDPATGLALESVPLSAPLGLNGLAAPDLATPAVTETWGRLKTMYR